MVKVGWGSCGFTPTRPAMIQGQKNVRVGREAMDPLTLTAMVVDGGDSDSRVVMVSIDMAYPSDGMYQQIRQAVKAKWPEIDGDHIMLTATHTHTSLVVEDGFYEYPGGDVMSPEECETWISEHAVQAIGQAWESRRPMAIGRAFGHAVVGHNRHAVYADGHAQMYGKTNVPPFSHFGGYEDHSVDMLFTWEADGTLAGVALAVPCPSQVDESMSVFSADYWHEVRAEIRKRFGDHVQVLELCSAAGDQSPHFLAYGKQEAEMRQRRGITERQEIAERVADAVRRALACTKPGNDDVTVAHQVKTIALTPRRILQHERDWAQEEYERCVKAGDTTSWWPVRIKQVVDYFDGIEQPLPFSAELHVVRIGDAVIATNPFELFLDYGMRIKTRSDAAQTILVQLTGRGFYLPSQRAVDGGGYGAMPAVSIVGPEGGNELVEETLAMIGQVMGAEATK